MLPSADEGINDILAMLSILLLYFCIDDILAMLYRFN